MMSVELLSRFDWMSVNLVAAHAILRVLAYLILFGAQP